MNTIIEQIKAEIERLKDENSKIKCQANERYCSGYDDAFYNLVPFLSTLESEKPLGLEEEIKRYYDDMDGDCRYTQTARHFYDLGHKEETKEGLTKYVRVSPGLLSTIGPCTYILDIELTQEELIKTGIPLKSFIKILIPCE